MQKTTYIIPRIVLLFILFYYIILCSFVTTRFPRFCGQQPNNIIGIKGNTLSVAAHLS